MADAATQRLVDQIVQEKIQAGAMFTAYDITLEARRRGGTVRHQDVRDLVHEFYEQGRLGAAYNRTLIDVGAPTRPFLYHRFSDDPNSYRPPPSGTTGASPAPAAPPASTLRRLLGKLFGRRSTTRGTAPAQPPAGAAAPGTPAAPPPERKPATLGLDASQFLPISRQEFKDAARELGRLWFSPWFGRRDLIPPADDDRTRLIDRALVTQGLLTPEQLAEIHRVGAEMDRLRPDVIALRHQASRAGEAAVQAERAQKAQLKEQKKAEAAERRQRRVEAIAHRRATDIQFLGRGVSGRLGDRRSDPQKLEALGLPVLSTPAELATALGLTIPQLRWLAFHTEVARRVHYISFTIPKRSGGVRTLSAPHCKLAAVQSWIFQQILTRLLVEQPAHGFIPGRSILTNAQPHTGRAIVVNMDLEAFFPSITFPRVRSVFHRLGYSPSVATILALLCTECPRRQVEYDGQIYHVATGPRGLPQGACTSPALSNQIARRLDKRLGGLAAKLGLTYTRYADDLTFSGDGALNERVGYLMARVRHLAEEEGFAVNEKKNRVLRRNTAQTVTGLVVNERPGVARAEVRRIRAILHRARAEGLDAQNREGRPHFRPWLQGKIAYIGMSRPEVGARLQAALDALLQTE
ncbi:MAG: reverse transcriptase family protein [Gemmataceae bacterium]|nr:reverse transcriptase family protein [Gemmataceae bacterium]